jgi:hypothetical protein
MEAATALKVHRVSKGLVGTKGEITTGGTEATMGEITTGGTEATMGEITTETIQQQLWSP